MIVIMTVMQLFVLEISLNEQNYNKCYHDVCN